MELNPQEQHYFKRELISQQIHNEIESIKKDYKIEDLVSSGETEHPFIKYIVKNFVSEFPFLKKGNQATFWVKLQSFLDEYSKLKLDTYTPRKTRDSQRRVLLYKLEKLIVVTLTATIKTLKGNEESIRIPLREETEDELAEKLDLAHLESEEDYLDWIGTNGIKLNVVSVRDINEKRTLREVSHSTFIVETRFAGDPTQRPLYVARRHGQFRQLREDLCRVFPTLNIPTVPSKAHDSSYSDKKSSHLYREKDRIQLRSFLRGLCVHSDIVNSEIFQDFLSKDTITMTTEELADAQMRNQMDQKRRSEEIRFKEEVDKKMCELDGLLDMLKRQIMKPNGLIEIFNLIKAAETIDQLPEELRKAFEWGRINFAFVLHTQFVTSDRSIENIANLKRTHSLMPYGTITMMLKVYNPFAMVKGILDLFLAQPFGGRSLFQRILLANMHDEVKEMQKEIAKLEEVINDPVLCTKIANAVKYELPPDTVLKGQTPIMETLELLKNAKIKPVLTSQQIMSVAFANQEGKEESRKLVMNLYQLWVFYARQQEHEVLMSLIFQGVTAEIIKDLFAIFYEPLAEVYKAANIDQTISHLSDFVDDLVQVIDGLNVEDATHSAQTFIDLVQRHEGQFYQFVHNVHSKDESKIFDNLLSYVDDIFSFVANGIPDRIDMDAVVAETGLGPNDYPLLKEEIGSLCDYHLQRKQRHMDRRRQKLMASVADEEEMFDFLPDSKQVMGVISDMAESEYEDSLDEVDMKHELTIPHPKLTMIPTITPAFVRHVRKIINL
ncbi:hypothetical protein BDB01DRAFT_845727 [Pilobolus umbonatus]|nr:hypothetical protein BDB01DRAFT_845727 [Pilobolus umbonatus]